MQFIYSMIFVWKYDNTCCSSGNSSNNNNNKIKKKNNRLQKREQIPTEYNEEQTLRVIRKQDQILGERGRSKTINDIQNTAALAQLLKGLGFPADKSKIVEFVQRKKTDDPKSNQILPVLDKIEERQYKNVADVTLSAKLVE
jgi:Protein of unknown function (DUF2795)